MRRILGVSAFVRHSHQEVRWNVGNGGPDNGSRIAKLFGTLSEMKPSVYIETTIISYLAARPSRDVIVAGQQQTTRMWWDDRSSQFDLVTSELVLREAAVGDAGAAARRAALLIGMRTLASTAEAESLATLLLARVRLPRKAALDAGHVAVAAVHGVDFLVTWNCTHIANAVLRPRIESTCREAGYMPPTICTPFELM